MTQDYVYSSNECRGYTVEPPIKDPPYYGHLQQATVPNYFLYYTVHSYLRIADLSILRVTDTKYRPQTLLSIDRDSERGQPAQS